MLIPPNFARTHGTFLGDFGMLGSKINHCGMAGRITSPLRMRLHDIRYCNQFHYFREAKMYRFPFK